MSRWVVQTRSVPDTIDGLRSIIAPPRRPTARLLALALPLGLAPAWHLVWQEMPATPVLGSAAGLVLSLLLLTSAYTDLSEGKIYNWATYPAFLWAVAINGLGALGNLSGWRSSVAEVLGSQALPLGDIGLGGCLLGGLTCFGIMTVIYLTAGGGAGDVKLATAIGALIGIERGLVALVDSYLIAATFIVAHLLWRIGPLALAVVVGRKLGAMLLPGWVDPPTAAQDQLLRSPVRLAVFFALGTFAVFLEVGPC
jgi:Flp pilus assembly protein protease CpaA